MKRASKHQSNWPIAHEKQTLSLMDAQKDRQAGRLTVFCVSTSLQTWGTCVGHLWVWRHKMHSKIYGHGSLKGNWLETTSMILVIMSSTMIITIQEINKVDKKWKNAYWAKVLSRRSTLLIFTMHSFSWNNPSCLHLLCSSMPRMKSPRILETFRLK